MKTYKEQNINGYPQYKFVCSLTRLMTAIKTIVSELSVVTQVTHARVTNGTGDLDKI